MAIYTVHNTIESAANLWDVELDGYLFNQKDAVGSDLVVSKKIEADHHRTALQLFNQGLFPLLDGLALHRLSATSAYGTSLLIEKEGVNHALLRTLKRIPGTGLTLTGSDHFSDACQEIVKLAKAHDPTLFYFRHALLSNNVISSTMHLLQAAESLAGKVVISATCRNPQCKASPVKCEQCQQEVQRPASTDQKQLKALLGKKMYVYFYNTPVGGNSVRNMIFHGEAIDLYGVADWHEELEEAIKAALIKKHDLKAVPDVKGTRSLYSYQGGHLMIEFKEPLPPLPVLVNMMHNREITSASEPAFISGDRAVTLGKNF